MGSPRVAVVFRFWQGDKENHGWREGPPATVLSQSFRSAGRAFTLRLNQFRTKTRILLYVVDRKPPQNIGRFKTTFRPVGGENSPAGASWTPVRANRPGAAEKQRCTGIRDGKRCDSSRSAATDPLPRLRLFFVRSYRSGIASGMSQSSCGQKASGFSRFALGTIIGGKLPILKRILSGAPRKVRLQLCPRASASRAILRNPRLSASFWIAAS